MIPKTADDLAVLTRLRRELHARPELSNAEDETAGRIDEFMAGSGPDRVVRGLGGHGLAAVFEGTVPGPSVLLRAELDALPIDEVGGPPWSTTNPGVSHRCGHDGHMAILAGIALRLGRVRPARGRAVLLFQPAEETGEGARRVVEDAAFAELEGDWCFALHNLPGWPRGEVLLREGTFAAGSIGLVAALVGETSHAAYPEEGRSPALAMARLIEEMTRLPERIGAFEGLALATVIHARLGEIAFGTTPGYAEVMATLRADREEVLERLKAAVPDLLPQVAGPAGLEQRLSWADEFPVTVNHAEAVRAVRSAAAGADLTVSELSEPMRWSEDFGWFTGRARGALFGLGTGRDHPPLHGSDYDFPDDLIAPGVEVMHGIVRDLLGETA